MDIWDYFRIEPTLDEKIIKKAYFSLLKENKPEQNSEGFIKLRSLYEALIEYVRHTQSTNFEQALAEVNEEERVNENDKFNLNKEIHFYKTKNNLNLENKINESYPDTLPLANQLENESKLQNFSHLQNKMDDVEISRDLIQKVSHLLESKSKLRKNEQLWRQILQDNNLWNFRIKKIFSNDLFSIISDLFACEKHSLLSTNIFLMLDDFCLWTESEEELCSIFSHAKVEHTLESLNKLRKNGFIKKNLFQIIFLKDLTLEFLFLSNRLQYPLSDKISFYLGVGIIVLAFIQANAGSFILLSSGLGIILRSNILCLLSFLSATKLFFQGSSLNEEFLLKEWIIKCLYCGFSFWPLYRKLAVEKFNLFAFLMKKSQSQSLLAIPRFLLIIFCFSFLFVQFIPSTFIESPKSESSEHSERSQSSEDELEERINRHYNDFQRHLDDFESRNSTPITSDNNFQYTYP